MIPLLLLICIGLAAAQKTTTTIRPGTSSHWVDPALNGRWNNPGARMTISNKTLDLVHKFAADGIAKTYMNMSFPDYHVSIDNGQLNVESPKITEFMFADVHANYSLPARVHSRFHDGRLVANGAWSYRQVHGRNSLGPMGGTYRLVVTNAEINTTTQLERDSNGKPWVQMIDCDAWLGEFKVDVQGAPGFPSFQNTNDPVSNKIRVYFEEYLCAAVRHFVKHMINARLATFPNSLLIDAARKIEIDYDLKNEPKFVNGSLQAGLEGKTMWRGSNVPFSPNDLSFKDTDRMLAFELSDFTFNTLLQQAHSQGFRYSAAQLLGQSVAIKDQLSLDCSKPSSVIQTRKYKPKTTPKPKHRALESDWKCLGAVFDNSSTSIGKYLSNQTGDLVFKSTQKTPSVYVLSADKAFFDASNGVLEIYGPVDRLLITRSENEKRQVLAKAEIRVLRGQFVPKFLNGNFTGSIEITEFELKQGAIGLAAQTRIMDGDWMSRLQQFAKPMLTDMFNVFLEKYAQFPVPLPGFKCTSPEFTISARTMQVDCDLQSSERL